MASSSSQPQLKRYRREEKAEKDKSFDSDDDNYVPYVPVRERKKNELLRLGKLVALKDTANKSSSDNDSDEDQSQEVLGRKYK